MSQPSNNGAVDLAAAKRLPRTASGRALTTLPSRSLRNRARSGLYRLRAGWAWELLVERGDTVVLVGAPWPNTLSRLLVACGQEGKVVAIEAVRANYERLERYRESLPAEEAASLVLIHGAAFNERRLIQMRLTDENDARHKLEGLEAEVDVPPGTEFERTETVEADTLDAMLAEHGIERANLMIVTVNGAEREVLQGAERALARMPRHSRIFVKTHARTSTDGTIFDDVAAFLAERGFRVVRTRRSTSRDLRWAFRAGDAFAHKA
jgi:FkbM family methyltransferase